MRTMVIGLVAEVVSVIMVLVFVLVVVVVVIAVAMLCNNKTYKEIYTI
jgi:hypothetical protein